MNQLFGRRNILSLSFGGALSGLAPFVKATNEREHLPMALGVCTHLWSSPPHFVDKALQVLADSAIEYVRWEIPWKLVEAQRRKYAVPKSVDLIAKNLKSLNIKSILILGYGNDFYNRGGKPESIPDIKAFASYAGYMAEHYEGIIDYLEIWNEWDTKNGGTSYSSVENYINLVRSSVEQIRKKSNLFKILAGGFSAYTYHRFVDDPDRDPYLYPFLKSDVVKYIDALSVHAYVRGMPFAAMAARLDTILNQITSAWRASSGGKDAIITEIGWSTADGVEGAVAPAEQMAMLKKALALSLKHDIRATCIYELRDTAGDEGYGLYDEQWQPKPAAKLISEEFWKK